jgi:outer membrane protein assembly factor BamB
MRQAALSALISSVLFCQYVYAYSGGDGTQANPYQLATKSDLVQLGATSADYGKAFVMTADIDLAGETFSTALIATDLRTFTGIFDGAGHSITGFTINGGNYLGLFGTVGAGGVIKNVAIVDCSITASSSSACAGGLAGRNYGCIYYCSSSGNISASSAAGGLAGTNSGSLWRCRSVVNVTSSGSSVGGLAGGSTFGSITQCRAGGSVSGINSVGGLVGTAGSISNCYATGSVSGSSNVGGLAGNVTTATRCYSTGLVTGTSTTGGLAGSGAAVESFWNIETSGQPTGSIGTGKTTAEMQDINTFLAAGWDFAGEATNGSADCWTMPEAPAYPALAEPSAAATILVPQQYATIQAGIDAAIGGDSVIIAQGTYISTGNVNVTFRGKPIAVRSTDPNDPNVVAATIVDCKSTAKTIGFSFVKGEGPLSVLAGLTIKNGSADPITTSGWAVDCANSSPRIEKCVVLGESTTLVSSPIVVAGTGVPVFSGCTVTSKTGGVFIYGGHAVLEKCRLVNNISTTSGYNALAFDTTIGGTADCRDCLFAGNKDGYTSGGRSVRVNAGTANFVNCTFAGGGAVYVSGTGSYHGTVDFYNCLLANGKNSVGVISNGGTTSLRYCGVTQGRSGIGPLGITGSGGTAIWGEGNFDCGPDAGFSTGYSLRQSSICINKGDPNYVAFVGETDIFGQPRMICGRVDVGATEAPLGIELLTPQEGEVIAGGSARSVRWVSQADAVDIYFSSTGGMTWGTVATAAPNTGRFAWTAQRRAAAACKIAVEGINGTDRVRAESGTFSIRPYMAGQPAASGWSTIGGNPQRRGLSSHNGPVTGSVRWAFETFEPVSNSVAVGPWGIVYVACDSGIVYAIDELGQMLWGVDLETEITSSPSVGLDGSVYIGCSSGELMALSYYGDILWTRKTGGMITGAPAVGTDGRVFVGSTDGKVYCLSANGSDIWEWQSPHAVAGSAAIVAPPTLGLDGSVLIADAYWPILYSLDPNDGSVKWQVDFTMEIRAHLYINGVYVYVPGILGRLTAAPVVGPSGNIYVCFDALGRLCQIDPNGTRGWTTAVSDPATTNWFDPFSLSHAGGYLGLASSASWSEAVIGPDGKIYLSMEDPFIRAIEPNGVISWVTRCGLQGGFKLTVGADGMIYACGDEGSMYVVAPNGDLESVFDTETWMSYPVIGADGIVYVSDHAGVVWALGEDNAAGERPGLRRLADAVDWRGVDFIDYATALNDWLKTTWDYKSMYPNGSPSKVITDRRFLSTDVNRDAYVDIKDIAIIMRQWLQD